MSFFVTSEPSEKGGDLGGLTGADAGCVELADAAGASRHTWRAYLSAAAVNGEAAVNARDRIGNEPWLLLRGELSRYSRTARQSGPLHFLTSDF